VTQQRPARAGAQHMEPCARASRREAGRASDGRHRRRMPGSKPLRPGAQLHIRLNPLSMVRRRGQTSRDTLRSGANYSQPMGVTATQPGVPADERGDGAAVKGVTDFFVHEVMPPDIDIRKQCR